MGSYRFVKPKEDKGMPSGWRGIGCLLMIILPIFSYFAAVALLEVDSIRGVFASAMPGLFGRVTIPRFLLYVTSLNPVWVWLQSINNLWVNLVFGIIILVVLSGIIGIFYSIMYNAMRPAKYGPTDAPPPKRRKGKQKYSR